MIGLSSRQRSGEDNDVQKHHAGLAVDSYYHRQERIPVVPLDPWRAQSPRAALTVLYKLLVCEVRRWLYQSDRARAVYELRVVVSGACRS